MKQYPCEIKTGDIFRTKDGRVWHIRSYDGKFIYTREGAQYAPKHPDIIGFEEDEEAKEQQKPRASRGIRRKHIEEIFVSEDENIPEEEIQEPEE